MNDKYLVFSGTTYYPDGGWKDYQGAFSSLEEAIEKINSLEKYDHWAHIVYDSKIICRAHGEYEWTFKNEG